MPELSAEQVLSVSERRAVLDDVLYMSFKTFCLQEKATFDDNMKSIMTEIAKAMGAGRIIIDRCVDPNGGYRIKQLYRWDSGASALIDSDYALLPENPITEGWLEALRSGRPVSLRLSDLSEEERAFLSGFGIDSFIAVPFFSRGEFWGCAAFQNFSDESIFDESLMDLIEALACLCAGAIRNDEIWRHLIEAEERARTMLDATPLCSFLWTSDYELVDCNETTIEFFGFRDKKDCLDNFIKMFPKYQPDGQLSRHTAQMHVLKTLEQGRSFFDWTLMLSDGTLMPVEMTLVKVKIKGELFVVGFARDLLQLKVMENSIIRLRSESEKIYYDPLTGIFNRRFFDENLNGFIKTLSRSSGILSLLMIDIDYFKNYNDSYGHSAGDDCLKIVAKTLKNNVTRADDFVVRYGGEEFAVVLPNTDEDGARLLADKMLESIRSCKIQHRASSVADIVTISIGVTTGEVGNTSRADDFIIRADELLYLSKQNGRNRSTYGRL